MLVLSFKSNKALLQSGAFVFVLYHHTSGTVGTSGTLLAPKRPKKPRKHGYYTRFKPLLHPF
jgi:hypothetical protein